MKQLISLEEVAQCAFAVFLNTYLPYAWWWYWVWFLAPDLSMIGYVINTKVGAFTYNIVHHKAIALACYVAGVFMKSSELQFAGLVLLGHSALDRALGYGLKYRDHFQHTHLGRIGKQQ